MSRNKSVLLSQIHFLEWPFGFLLSEAVIVARGCPLLVSWVLLISLMQKYQHKQVLQIVFKTKLYLTKHWGYSFIIHGEMCITKENSVLVLKFLSLHILELSCSSLNGCLLLCLFFVPPTPLEIWASGELWQTAQCGYSGYKPLGLGGLFAFWILDLMFHSNWVFHLSIKILALHKWEKPVSLLISAVKSVIFWR